MDQEQMEKILEGPEDYDDSKEDSIYSVVEQLYGKKMHSNLILHGSYIFFFFALAAFCAVKFFMTDLIQFQIMYAALFVCCMQFVAHRKTVYWQGFHRNSIKREIKRLELRIAELAETVKTE